MILALFEFSKNGGIFRRSLKSLCYLLCKFIDHEPIKSPPIYVVDLATRRRKQSQKDESIKVLNVDREIETGSCFFSTMMMNDFVFAVEYLIKYMLIKLARNIFI